MKRRAVAAVLPAGRLLLDAVKASAVDAQKRSQKPQSDHQIEAPLQHAELEQEVIVNDVAETAPGLTC